MNRPAATRIEYGLIAILIAIVVAVSLLTVHKPAHQASALITTPAAHAIAFLQRGGTTLAGGR